MLGKQFDNVLHHLSALFDVSHLATTKQNGHLHFIIVLEKTDSLLHLELNVVFARFGSNANLFQFCLMLFTFGGPFTFVVLELSIVHDATNRWLGFGRDFDEIEPVFTGLGQCVGCWDDA